METEETLLLLTSEHLSQNDLKVIGVRAVTTSNIRVLEKVLQRLSGPNKEHLVWVAFQSSQVDPLVFFGLVESEPLQGCALMFLCCLGELEHVRSLFDLGVAYNAYTFEFACASGNLELVKFILERFASEVDDLTRGLNRALSRNHSEVIRFLLNLNKPINFSEAVPDAALSGDLNLFKQVLTLAGGPSEVPPEKLTSALQHACEEGDLDILRFLLDLKVPVEPEVFLKVPKVNVLMKQLLLQVLPKDLSLSTLRTLLPDLQVRFNLRRFQKTWRRLRRAKASKRMNLCKDELLAVVFSPERLSSLFPEKVPSKGQQQIRRAVKYLKGLF